MSARAAALLLGIDGALDEAADEARFIDEVMRGDLVARGLIARFSDVLLSQRNHCVPMRPAAEEHMILQTCALYQMTTAPEFHNGT